MKKIILMLLLCPFNVLFAQDLMTNYEIVVWNKSINNSYKENHLQTIGFLPVFDNTKDDYIIGETTYTYKSNLNIQILNYEKDNIKISLDFENNFKKYKKELILKNEEIKDLDDFKIKVIKK